VQLPRSFGARLALLAGAGFAIRLGYTLAFSHGVPVTGDALVFHLVGHSLSVGDGFFRPPDPELPAALGTGVTAEHPPLFELLIGGLDLVGLNTVSAQKAFMCFVGTGTVALIGLSGRTVAGERAGLIAAGIAALYPFLWVADGSLMSESLYGALIAAVLLVALLFARQPTFRLALALGALIGLAALTRGEGLILIMLLLLPLILTRRVPWDLRAGLAGAALAAVVLVLSPWLVRNAVTFDDPVLLSTDSSAVFAGANCQTTYHGNYLGLWDFRCYGSLPPGDESEKASEYRRRGLRHARDQAGRWPVVVAARLGRVWDFYRPFQQVHYEYFEGRSRTASRLGLVIYYPLLLLAVAGAVILRRRRATLLPLLALPLTVSVTAALVYGLTRFRFAAEPALVVLAAVTVDSVIARRL
jgi:4-amino-4-deoxy-L-arabinose transferase-like glycosyltransferase